MRRLIVEEPISRAAVWSRRTAVFALATAGVAIGLSRFGIDPAAALTVFGAALALALLAVLLASAAAVVIWRLGRRGAKEAAVAVALALALLADPAYLTIIALRLPAINDVTTDFVSPPSFMISAKARQARAGVTLPPWSAATGALQKAAYPEVQPILVDLEPEQAYQLALRVAKDLGWRVVELQPAQPARRRRRANRGDGSNAVVRLRRRHRHPRAPARQPDAHRHPFGVARRQARFRRQRAPHRSLRRGGSGVDAGAVALTRAGIAP